MAKKEVLYVAGARPNFMKIAPIMKAMKSYPDIVPFLVHTGQHYDRNMSQNFFEQLKIPRPDINLGVGSGTHGFQTGQVIQKMEAVLCERDPALVVTVGDVNSTMAATIAASKLMIPTAHIEAGLRSGDRTMPEEINRLVTDALADLLFTHCREANLNLRNEGVPEAKIKFVGNVMIDTLDQMIPQAKKLKPLSEESYGLITLHRPSNVDQPEKLKGFFAAFDKISEFLPLFFPMHPRTAERLKEQKILVQTGRIHLLEPMPYLSFLRAMMDAKVLLTDSGGIQEETTALGVSCLTLRTNSERMVTVHEGTNQIIGEDPNDIVQAASAVMEVDHTSPKRPELWDGKASDRICAIISAFLS